MSSASDRVPVIANRASWRRRCSARKNSSNAATEAPSADSSGSASSCGELPTLSTPVFNVWRSGNV